MNEKKLGIGLIVAGLLIVVISIFVKIYNDSVNGCNGCSWMVYFFFWLFGGFVVVLGLLLFRTDELDKHLAESSIKMNDEFKKTKEFERQKEGFQDFLKDFNKNEKEIIEILHTYEGITFKQLEKKVTFSKEKMNSVLKTLEKKEILSVMDSKKVYLTKLS
jgi:hypothetical protein